MSDDKKKAEHHFNWQAIVERIKPELVAASEAAHKAKDTDAEDDPDDRTMELGSLVQCLSGICGPHLMLLHEIAHALDEIHNTEGDAEVEQERPHRPH